MFTALSPYWAAICRTKILGSCLPRSRPCRGPRPGGSGTSFLGRGNECPFGLGRGKSPSHPYFFASICCHGAQEAIRGAQEAIRGHNYSSAFPSVAFRQGRSRNNDFSPPRHGEHRVNKQHPHAAQSDIQAVFLHVGIGDHCVYRMSGPFKFVKPYGRVRKKRAISRRGASSR